MLSSRIFESRTPCESIHSQSRRMVMISPEPNFWIHAVSIIHHHSCRLSYRTFSASNLKNLFVFHEKMTRARASRRSPFTTITRLLFTIPPSARVFYWAMRPSRYINAVLYAYKSAERTMQGYARLLHFNLEESEQRSPGATA